MAARETSSLPKHRLVLIAVIVVVFAAALAAKWLVAGGGAPSQVGPVEGSRSYRRIVSLAPSTTEMLFALDLGDRVVGVTRYCDYPQEALGRAKVGGYYDPNYEAIVDLKPDLVVMLAEHVKARKDLTGLGIETLSVSNKVISDIQNAILAIGTRCGTEDKARAIVSEIKGRLDHIEEKTRRLPRPRVMISVGRNMGSGSLKDVYIAGRGTFYDEMIALAGGENAYEGGTVKYAALSAEGILELDPDVIIDLVADLEREGLEKEAVLRDWRTVAGAGAVKAGRVHVLSQDYVVIPGPRFVLLVEDLARIVHPEIDWD